MKPYLFLLGLLLAGLITVPRPCEARLDPRLHWSAVETPHFLILFHDEAAEIAGRAATIAEEAHQQLAPELHWEPADKTRLILADVSDAPNGMATPFPFNRIIIYLSPPLETPFSITDREEWLRIVITHEYAHILHLDNVQQGPATVRKIFGRLYFPNVFQPNWLIEGLATYEETLHSPSGGRGRASYTEMLLRTATLAHRFPDLSQGAVAPDSWPGGEVPYLYGVSFYQYLVGKYGPDLPGRISQVYAGRSLPFMVDSTARTAFGSTYEVEWLLWQIDLEKKYKEQARAIAATGLSDITLLTFAGGMTIAPSPSPDGRSVAYTSRTPDRSYSLIVAERNGRSPQLLLRRAVTPASAGIAWLPDSSALIYSKLERDRYDNLYSDLFRYDLQEKREERLTVGLRSGSPDLSPLTGEILCTSAHANGNRLTIVSADGKNRRDLTEVNDPRLFADPRWSPDGKSIAVAVKTPDGHFLIQILDQDGNLRTTLPDAGAINSNPSWSRDGQHLFFSSDRNGIYNLYAYRMASGEIFQITNLLGGAFTPQVSSDDKTLLFSVYDVEGFDLAQTAIDPQRWQLSSESPSSLQAAPDHDVPALQPVTSAAKPYSPWTDLRPRYWLPWISTDEVGTQYGLMTSGSDALDRHLWTAVLSYGPRSHRPAYSLNYQYDGLTPTLKLTAADQSIPYADFFTLPSGRKSAYWEERRTLGLDLILPGNGLWSRNSLSLGFRHEDFSAAISPPPGFQLPAEGELSALRLGYQFDNTLRPAKAISAEGGRAVAIAAQSTIDAIGSDFSRRKYTLDWREYIDLPTGQHQVFATRLFGGMAQGDILPQRAFQLGGDPPGELLQGLDDEVLPLRGYPVNSLRGQRALLASAEYRFPLLNLERGVGNGPLYLRRLHGALFAEGGEAFDQGGVKLDQLHKAIGAEARCDLDLGYRLPLTLRVVLAKGLDEGGEKQGYLTLWLRF